MGRRPATRPSKYRLEGFSKISPVYFTDCRLGLHRRPSRHDRLRLRARRGGRRDLRRGRRDLGRLHRHRRGLQRVAHRFERRRRRPAASTAEQAHVALESRRGERFQLAFDRIHCGAGSRVECRWPARALR